jgi:hypothetical protein
MQGMGSQGTSNQKGGRRVSTHQEHKKPSALDLTHLSTLAHGHLNGNTAVNELSKVRSHFSHFFLHAGYISAFKQLHKGAL